LQLLPRPLLLLLPPWPVLQVEGLLHFHPSQLT